VLASPCLSLAADPSSRLGVARRDLHRGPVRGPEQGRRDLAAAHGAAMQWHTTSPPQAGGQPWHGGSDLTAGAGNDHGTRRYALAAGDGWAAMAQDGERPCRRGM
jgi:hypothetical protein